jgi:uncharacterized damage-inducible protein DinB
LSRTSHVRLMASYNEWMNTRLYAAAAALPAAALAADRKAFFGSILGTLGHLVNADIIWLKRFASHPAGYAALADVAALAAPPSLAAPRATDLAGLAEQRRQLDAAILALAHAVSEADLDHALRYTNSQGLSERNFFGLLMHFFNHQTHHRGQATTLLAQEGVDMGVTDLLMLVPNEVQA